MAAGVLGKLAIVCVGVCWSITRLCWRTGERGTSRARLNGTVFRWNGVLV